MKTTSPPLLVLSIFAISAAATAETPAPPNALMCTPGELIFSEGFDPATVSGRWGFKAEFALRDGALLRTDVDPTETKRVFQFDLPGASIDNVRVWKATGQRDNWIETRKKLAMAQADRDPVKRDPAERYKIEYANLKSRLTLEDQTYRDLVAKRERLQAALHADYAEAFTTHKQLSKLIAKRKQHIKATDPDFKRMEIEVHRASRAEDAYVLSTKPELARLKEDGIPKHRFPSELGQVRARLEAAGDKQLAALVAETTQRQAALEARFPEAFESVDAAVKKRNAIRKSLNDDPEFQDRNRAVVDAGKAIKDYEYKAAPNLAQLAADAKAYVDSLKSSNAK